MCGRYGRQADKQLIAAAMSDIQHEPVCDMTFDRFEPAVNASSRALGQVD